MLKSNLDLWYSCDTQIKVVSLLGLNTIGFTRSEVIYWVCYCINILVSLK